MSHVLSYIWLVIQILVGYNLVLPFLFFLFYLVVKKTNTPRHGTTERDYAIIVTAYEQTHTLGLVVDSILAVNYSNYLIYIVADNCDVSQLHFADERVIVLRPEEILRSNVKSHFYAINRFRRPHTHLTIIDSDNLVDVNYLLELDKFFDKGYSAVQGERKPKNLDTTIAALDAARDVYYHFYDGEVLFALGSSAALAGSGMAFTVKLYRDCLENYNFSGAGFDKVLQFEIVKRNYRIACAPNAVVFDEKTSQSGQLVNQRARWINTWFKYSWFGFLLIARGITRFSINQLLFGIMLVRPPLFIFLLLSGLFFFSNIILLSWGVIWWGAGFLLFVAGFMIALIHAHADKRIFAALKGIPRFVSMQVQSLLKARGANKRSVATSHFHTAKIEEIKNNDNEN
ncbi:MAG TPA: glycosyltransferase [Chitinophagaceae bacterium]|nr:glycosyltransferase [Chitinophagaceae bacterium]